ncbi:hypothetical protein F750_4400 [Streptomyces sp. PAMC 26508]|nr:hypothetical protein F750_4400 [Streptomyces sp. PAMC 26508]
MCRQSRGGGRQGQDRGETAEADRSDVDRGRCPARPGGHPGRSGAGRPGAAQGPQRAVVDRRRRGGRAGARVAQRALAAAARLHPEDALRRHGPARAAAEDADAPGDRGRALRRGRGEQPGGRQGGPLVHGPRPVARGVPALRQRRGARAVRDVRRRARDGRRDAAPRRGAPGPGHHGGLTRRLRRPAAGLQRLRPDPVRPERDAEGGLQGVRRDGHGRVPRRGEEGQEAEELRDPEHQPADHRGHRGGAVQGHRGRQERLHHPRGQHLHGDRRTRRAGASGDGHEPLVGGEPRRLQGGGRPPGLGFRGERQGDPGR